MAAALVDILLEEGGRPGSVFGRASAAPCDFSDASRPIDEDSAQHEEAGKQSAYGQTTRLNRMTAFGRFC